MNANFTEARRWFYDWFSLADAAIWSASIRSGEVDDRIDELIAAQAVFDAVLGPVA